MVDLILSCQASLAKVKPLVVCVQATSGEEASAESLEHRIEQAKKAGLTVSTYLTSVVLTRRFTKAKNTNRWDVAMELVRASSDDLKAVPEGQRAELQAMLVTELLLEYLRVEGDRKASAPCRKVCEALMTLTKLASKMRDRDLEDYGMLPDFRRELSALLCLVLYETCVSTEDLRTLQENREFLLSHRTGYFYKALTIFHTGTMLCSTTGEYLSKSKRDQNHEKDLDTHMERVETLDHENWVYTDESGCVIFPGDPQTVSAINACISNILANSSKALQKRRRTDIEKINGFFEDTTKGLLASMNASYVKSWEVASEACIDELAKEKPDPKAISSLLSQLVIAGPLAKDLGGVLPSDALVRLKKCAETQATLAEGVSKSVDVMVSMMKPDAASGYDPSLPEVSQLFTSISGVLAVADSSECTCPHLTSFQSKLLLGQKRQISAYLSAAWRPQVTLLIKFSEVDAGEDDLILAMLRSGCPDVSVQEDTSLTPKSPGFDTGKIAKITEIALDVATEEDWQESLRVGENNIQYSHVLMGSVAYTVSLEWLKFERHCNDSSLNFKELVEPLDRLNKFQADEEIAAMVPKPVIEVDASQSRELLIPIAYFPMLKNIVTIVNMIFDIIGSSM